MDSILNEKKQCKFLLKEKVLKFITTNYISIIFFVLSLIGLMFSGLSLSFLINETIRRFVRNGVLVLALIIPIRAGIGINFAITLGALVTQGAIVVALNNSLEGLLGVAVILGIGITGSILIGWLIGVILNKTKGKEMITSIIIGFIGSSIFQMIFMVCYGTIIPIKNKNIGLSRGMGIRDMVDLESYRVLFNKLNYRIGTINIPVMMILVVLLFGILVWYIMKTPFGLKVSAVGGNYKNSKLLGLQPDKIRIKAIIISTVLASIGQFFYLENIGVANVYTAQSNAHIFSSAAILAGGATLKKASVRNAFIGILLFHSLFIVSPQAGQNIFQSGALGEYFRSFIAYGTISIVIIMNIRKKK